MIASGQRGIMADDIGNMSRSAPTGAAVLRFVVCVLALLGFGLMLGACSKCDVPNWQHSSAGAAPAACHGEPSPQ
jgi:recombinational DNA repair protein (RecF pathway)